MRSGCLAPGEGGDACVLSTCGSFWFVSRKGPRRRARSRRHLSSSWGGCRCLSRRGSCRTRCGSGSSRCCRRWSGASGSRVASGGRIGRPCRGSCSCCTRGSPGGTCRSSSASAPARPAIGAWMSGNGPASGSGCTRCCLRSCMRRVRWNGRGRSLIPVMCRRKRGLRDGPEPG